MKRHIMQKIVSAIFVLILSSPNILAEETLDSRYLSKVEFQSIHDRLQKKDPDTVKAYQELLTKANAALNHQSRAMEDFKVLGFYSKDREEHLKMKNLLSGDSSAALLLALAWKLSEKEHPHKNQYALKAIEILDHWATINRSYSGSDGKLVMCYNGTGFIFTADILDDCELWKQEQRKRFQNWLHTVLIPVSKIKKRDNNWACWGILASIASHRFLKDQEGFDSDVERLKEIIDEQIAPDGSMPHELKRGERSFWYTYFALAPLTAAMNYARKNGAEDLFQYQPPSGGTVKEAIEFFYERGMKDQEKWPVKIDEEITPDGKYALLLFVAGSIYEDKEWTEFAKHPLWRLAGGLAWTCPTLIRPEPVQTK